MADTNSEEFCVTNISDDDVYLNFPKPIKVEPGETEALLGQGITVTEIVASEQLIDQLLKGRLTFEYGTLTLEQLIEANNDPTGFDSIAYDNFRPNLETAVEFNFAGETSLLKKFDVGHSDVDVIQGMVYVTSTAVFSKEMTLTFYKKSETESLNALYRSTGRIALTALTVPASAGTSTITVDDSSDMEVDDLLAIQGTNTDLIRTSSIGASITLEDSLSFAHAAADPVALVVEFGGFRLVDLDATNQLYAEIEFDGGQTVDIKLTVLLNRK